MLNVLRFSKITYPELSKFDSFSGGPEIGKRELYAARS